MNATRIDLLQAMPIFGALRDDTLAYLLQGAREVCVPAQGWFFREGDAAASLFVLQAGGASVLKAWKGRQYPLRRLGPGDCFGEMALMDLLPRSASVRADEACRAIELGAGDLQRLAEHDLEQFALMQMNMGREVSRRLRETDELLFAAGMGEGLPEGVVLGHRLI